MYVLKIIKISIEIKCKISELKLDFTRGKLVILRYFTYSINVFRYLIYKFLPNIDVS